MDYLEILLLISLFIIGYVYIGFPILLMLWSKFQTKTYKPKNMGEPFPKVSIVISAYNEEKYIEEKINNALGLNYPDDRYEVIVISDGSSDKTVEIAQSFNAKNYLFIDQVERKGKTSALNIALSHINGEIVVYTDANVFIENDALLNLLEPFYQQDIGAVSSRVELRALDSGEPLGESAYMKYERYLQKRESAIYSMIGIDGGLFAVRRELVPKIPENIVLDDFFIVSNVLSKKYRILYQENALAFESVPASVSQEFRRKSRIAAGGFQVLKYLDYLRHPLSFKRIFFFFISHKLLRWLTPFFMIMALFSNSFLLDEPGYKLLFLAQTVFYALAVTGYLFMKTRNILIIYVPYYFVMMNIAFLVGFFKNLFREQKVTWNRVER